MELALATPLFSGPFQQLRRDWAMLVGGLNGHRPAPFHLRHPKPRVGISPRPFVVQELIRETRDSVTLRLADPSGSPIAFVPGQFFTLVVTLAGEELRRAYSVSSSPYDTSGICLTVKRVPGGRVSNYLNEQVGPGTILKLLGPSGEFTARGATELVLVAGGSGVTPMRSLLLEQLGAATGGRVTLVYGSRSAEDVIYADEFRRLAAEHSARFKYIEVLAEPDPSPTPREHTAPSGMLTRELLAQLLPAHNPSATHYFLCGPEGMLVEARAALSGLGVGPDRIREERFTQPHLRQKAAELPTTAQAVKLKVQGGETHAFKVAPGRTLLEAALEAGAPLPYSCAMGGCGRCKVKLNGGSVAMDEPNCLTAEEREQGYVLSCVGRPLSAIEAEFKL